jgi:hypothetical protein
MKVISSGVPKRNEKRTPGVIVGIVIALLVIYSAVALVYGAFFLGGLSVIEAASSWENPLGYWNCVLLMACLLPFSFVFRQPD